MSGGGLWNDYGACELEYHDTLLLAGQRHRMVELTPKRSRHMFSQYTSPVAQLVFVPLLCFVAQGDVGHGDKFS